jgi:hypothetical protein
MSKNIIFQLSHIKKEYLKMNLRLPCNIAREQNQGQKSQQQKAFGKFNILS